MKEAGITCVSLPIFGWSHLEPEEGKYDFDCLEDIIDKLYANGVSTFLATPTGAKPNCLSNKYEEVRRVNRNGQRELPGERHNHCYTSPVYREKMRKINQELAERFHKHPGVILWNLSNEYNGECFCPLCIDAFRNWLKKKYQTLENLNHEWWTHFWSHTYTSWEQIHPPFTHADKGVHGLVIDWKRFVTHQTVDFMREEIKAVREAGSDLPVTTNLRGLFPGLDYFAFGEDLDIVSWDSYPLWDEDDDKAPFSTTMSTAFRRI